MIPLLKIKIGMKQKISALIPTFNEEHNISDAIDSVSWADEILVVDSFSTDSTIEIAKKKGAKVIQRVYNYPASQKNWAIPQAKNDWIILIDADERIPYDLKTEIINILNKESSFNAFWIRRQNHFMGRKIRFSGWQGDKVIRLFKRDCCRYEDKNVHEEIYLNYMKFYMKKNLDNKDKETIEDPIWKNVPQNIAGAKQYSQEMIDKLNTEYIDENDWFDDWKYR